MIIERSSELGGILNQCIHNGFGLHQFHEELTGPEFAQRFIDQVHANHIRYVLDTTVLDIKKTDHFTLTVSSFKDGLYEIHAKAVILSTGCYEKTRGQISIPGERPKGIMPAGSAQRYLNMDGYLVGKKIFILGSGDIGLIMARRMTLEGADVLGVAEIMPYSNGLTRNIVQCLDDFDIPLYLSHTVTEIRGKDHLEGITIMKVDDYFAPIEGTEKHFEVDTLLLSIGLIPDINMFESLKINRHPMTKSACVNQHYETEVEGLLACGNALHVHDLVDWVTIESEKAGQSAKKMVLQAAPYERHHQAVLAGRNLRYVVPQFIDFNRLDAPVELSFRSTRKMEIGLFKVIQNGKVIKTKKAKFIAPAEMEKISVKPEEFLSSDEITVELEEIIS
jgi:NADPH-dependent 2,4-dienoyl-CoA reductase/sulfur reductase-like enzyme